MPHLVVPDEGTSGILFAHDSIQFKTRDAVRLLTLAFWSLVTFHRSERFVERILPEEKHLV